MSKYPQKITQIQCQQTNQELRGMFLSGLNSSFKYLPNFLQYIYHELQLLVGFLQYRFTIAQDQPLPGDKLQNITYIFQNKIDEKSKFAMTQTKKILWLVLNIIIPYVWKKVGQLINKIWGQRSQAMNQYYKICNIIEKIFNILDFVNLALFIRYGNYRSILQRVLKLRMKFMQSQSARILNFSLMNRQLLWRIYQLFLETIFQSYHKSFSKVLKNVFYLNSYLGVQQQNNCAICGCVEQAMTMPVQATPCGHKFCYYCAETQRKNQQKCKACGAEIRSWQKKFLQ